MKRYGYLYEKIYDIDNLKLAYKNAKRGKSYYQEILEFEKNIEQNLIKIQNVLINQNYKTSKYEIFNKMCGKKERKIFKLPFYPDRIVHWAIIQIVEPIFLKKLNGCTHSAIPKKGVHSAFKQVNKYIKSDKEGTKYCLKLDIKKFYPSINHVLLKNMYRKIFKDKRLIILLDEIIDSTDGDTGIPIGNYLSQYSGNLFLSDFDKWIKQNKSVKYYSRYMDDIVIFGDDKGYLRDLFNEIQLFLNKKRLKVKDSYQIFPTRNVGIDFVGYVHYGDYVLLRKSIAKELKKRMKIIRKRENITYSDYCSFNSYKGWLKWCNGYNLYKRHMKPLESKINKYYKEEIKNEK